MWRQFSLFNFKIFDFTEHRLDDGRQMLFVVMEFGSIDLSRVLKETASSERGLTGVKTKFYWEEMLEAVQVAHQVSALKRNLTYGFGATHVAFLVCRSESFNKK